MLVQLEAPSADVPTSVGVPVPAVADAAVPAVDDAVRSVAGAAAPIAVCVVSPLEGAAGSEKLMVLVARASVDHVQLVALAAQLVFEMSDFAVWWRSKAGFHARAPECAAVMPGSDAGSFAVGGFPALALEYASVMIESVVESFAKLGCPDLPVWYVAGSPGYVEALSLTGDYPSQAAVDYVSVGSDCEEALFSVEDFPDQIQENVFVMPDFLDEPFVMMVGSPAQSGCASEAHYFVVASSVRVDFLAQVVEIAYVNDCVKQWFLMEDCLYLIVEYAVVQSDSVGESFSLEDYPCLTGCVSVETVDSDLKVGFPARAVGYAFAMLELYAVSCVKGDFVSPA